MKHKILQWHPAFQAALQIELSTEGDSLQFHKEWNLSDKPLQIDTLIVKLDPGKRIQKNIGRIFRQYNIVEYKSPADYISINDFFKVNGYTCIYQASTEHEMEIPPEELTVTLAGEHYPLKLIRFLKDFYHAEVYKTEPGIYYVTGLLFPLQLLVLRRLSKEDNIWLSRLRGGLQIQEDMEPLAREYKGKEKNPLYEAAMDLIVRANWEIYKEGETMCDALRELFAEELEEREHRGIEKGTEKKLIQLVCKKLWKKKTVEEIAEDLEEDNAVIARICETAEKYAPDYDCEQIYEELAGR